MMIVRAAPDAAGAQREDAKDSHDDLAQSGKGQDRMMLLIVIDDEKPQDQQTREHAAGDFSGEMKIPERPDHGRQQKKTRREHAPPAAGRIVYGVNFGAPNQFFTFLHALDAKFCSGTLYKCPVVVEA